MRHTNRPTDAAERTIWRSCGLLPIGETFLDWQDLGSMARSAARSGDAGHVRGRPRAGGAGSPSGYSQRRPAGSREPTRSRGMAWGTPPDDDLGGAYLSASGSNRALLGRLALRPRALWLGSWWPVGQVRAETASTVAATQNGNPNALTEFATFELNPWEKQTANGVDQPAVHGSWNVRARRGLVSQHGGGDRQRAGAGDRAGRPAVRAEDPLDGARADRHLRRPRAERATAHHGLHRRRHLPVGCPPRRTRHC